MVKEKKCTHKEKENFENEFDEATQEKHTDSQNNEQKENDKSNEENEKLKNQLIKMQADFDNFLKRSHNEKQLEIFQIKKKIFLPLLARIDDFERMIKNTPEEQKNTVLYEALVSQHNMLLKDLEKNGLVAFESVGLEPNPDLHDVMTHAPGKEGIIIEEFQKGYKLGDELLREAKVIVGNGVEL